MLHRIIITFLLIFFLVSGGNIVYTADEDLGFTKLTTVDLHTFNEYKYKMTEQFFELRNAFEIDGSIDTKVATKMLQIAKEGYNYLPDNLINKNIFNQFKTAVERGLKYPDDQANYAAIVQEIDNYLNNTDIQKISGRIDAFPEQGNAPLTVTLRGNVSDPTGTKLPSHNYIWWMDEGGKRKIISTSKGPALNYTFREEGNFSIFLDVVSDHKNVAGFTDVLPFRSRADIQVKEKIASVIIKVNGVSLRDRDEIKFTPEEARYGLLFDATSSTPTSGTKFIKTEWEFGNGVKKEYEGAPNVERIIYNGEGEYRVKLRLKTNEGKTSERTFDIIVHNPIATIKSNLEQGFLGDKFTFSAENQISDDNLSYSWEVIDIDADSVVYRTTGSLFTYTFNKKGKYNVKLQVTEPSSTQPDIDTQIIHINSRAPEAYFSYSIPLKNKPNMVLLDATKSFDPDFSDEGKLKFQWVIDGQRVVLDKANHNGSIGYYTFNSIGDHSVVLEVTDPDGITVQRKDKVGIDSLLSVEFFAFPRVIQRNQTINFSATSPAATFFEWNFGDGEIQGGKDDKISHKYTSSGVFPVTLKVIDEDDVSNTFQKNVYVGESDAPVAFITLTNSNNGEVVFENDACDGKGAYMINRVDSIRFSGEESIDITGKNSGLSYSWKLGNDKYFSSNTFNKQFDELGCFPIQLKVTSDKNGKSDTRYIWVKVENLKPIISSLDVKIMDVNSDPVVVKVNALGAKDRDGVIQSYLWYYYTDIDPEPQDFRATKTPSTTFVLPKVTGNYYFVVLMKDNNEERITSEEVSGSKYFITLTGDNVNTPLVKLSASKNSVSIGEEVVFTAQVENILGQDISKAAQYSWDLDGDGFYEKDTQEPTTTYTFQSSGEFHAKVKAKYKGFSNTKSITMGVANILKPDFEYISLGNTFVFLDKSVGKYDEIEWLLAEDVKVLEASHFVHEYEDDKTTRIVEMIIREGEKVKSTKKKVVKNMKNFILSRKSGLNVFSSPEIQGGEIVLDKKEKVYLYFTDIDDDLEDYFIDTDMSYDADLNGSEDDDSDVSSTLEDGQSNSIEIELNQNHIQKVRIALKNTSGEVVENYTFKIIKNYLAEEIDISQVEFKGVSDSEKIKIEKLKDYVNALPKQYKLKALMYVQKLQEEWFDEREKTNVILEFEGYIAEVDPSTGSTAIDILESLLVEGQEDQSEKAIVFNALKNLLPQTIECGEILPIDPSQKCYDALIAKLEVIRDNNILDENRALGTQILKVVAEDVTMTNKQKTDFKAVLKTLVYGGVQNIPEEEKQEVQVEDTKSENSFISLLMTILFWIFIIFGVFALISLGYYIYYKLVNKDPNVGFQDFIIDRTSGKKQNDTKEKAQPKDILQSFVTQKEEKNTQFDTKSISEPPEVGGYNADMNQKNEVGTGESGDMGVQLGAGQIPTQRQAPSWLNALHETSGEFQTPVVSGDPLQSVGRNGFSEQTQFMTTSSDTSPTKMEPLSDDDIPNWLQGSFSDTHTQNASESEQTENQNIGSEGVANTQNREENQEKEVQEEEFTGSDMSETGLGEDSQGGAAQEESQGETQDPFSKNGEKQTKDAQDDGMPSWLQGSFGDENTSDTDKQGEVEAKSILVQDGKEEQKKSNNDEDINKIDEEDDDIPSWLKSTFDQPKKDSRDEGLKDEKNSKEDLQEDIPEKNLGEEKQDEKTSKETEIVQEKEKDGEQVSESKEKQQEPRGQEEKEKKENIDKAIQSQKKQSDQKQEENKKPRPKKKKPKTTASDSKTLEEQKVSKEKEKGEIKTEKAHTKQTNAKKNSLEKEGRKEVKPIKTEEKKEQKKQDDTSKKDEKQSNDNLWEDGMKIPDWLKTDSDK